jgi:hypothetical protein
MDSFNITTRINNEPTTITIVPSDNGENAYSTYYQLKNGNESLCDIFLNEDNEWEICKGCHISPEEFKNITMIIEGTIVKSSELYAKNGTNGNRREAIDNFSFKSIWNKLKNIFTSENKEASNFR